MPEHGGGGSTLGLCQWFHYEDDALLEATATRLRELGVQRIRTGVSWADFHRPHGRAWYDRQMAALADFDVLLSIWHTPPSIAEGGVCAGPPKRLDDFADFVEQIIDLYGDAFSHLELWNEPNNRYKWSFERFDPDWSKFGRMVGEAGRRASRHGVPTVLGGMMPVDHHWLELVKSHGALDGIDVVGIHGFPDMWWSDHPCWDRYHEWHGWTERVARIRAVSEGRPIWITETGLATWDLAAAGPARFQHQVRNLEAAAEAPAERTYWYSLFDLDPRREAIEGFHVDENEYHLGLVTHDGREKPAYARLARFAAAPTRG